MSLYIQLSDEIPARLTIHIGKLVDRYDLIGRITILIKRMMACHTIVIDVLDSVDNRLAKCLCSGSIITSPPAT
jgi:hypothetical protein